MKPQYRLSRVALIWQFIAIIVVVAPHLIHLPGWIPVVVLVSIGWRLMVHTGRWSFPNWAVRGGFALAATAGVLVSYGGIKGVNGMIALLVIGFSLKSLEVYKRRDALLVIYVAYLVAASALLFEQNVWMAAYVLLAVQVTTAALMAIYQTRGRDLARPFQASAWLMMQGLPLMLVLFIIIPRMGPLWSVKVDLGAARTGLSEEMAPGDITRLTRSSEVAFRVTFEGAPPPQRALYWRAMTYPDFDGHRWYRAPWRGGRVEQPDRLEPEGGPQRYRLLLEATGQHYVPALDLPLVALTGLDLQPDFTLRSTAPLNSRREYTLSSTPGYRLGADRSSFGYGRELRLPEGNPLSRQTALDWYQEAGDIDRYIGRLMAYFGGQFRYTLTPPALGEDGIDEFLFSTREGFCGHFSGAMVFMLRAAGIPARVVAGYQGGEWNPEGYLMVRQYDAHAWVEAWLPQRGWVRFDPTAAVAPERVEQPADALFAGQEGFLEEAPLAGLVMRAGGWAATLRQHWDAFNYDWQRWVVNYHQHQTRILSDLLGAITPLRMALALMLPFILILGWVAVRLLWRRQPVVRDPYDRALDALCAALAKQGLARAPGETVGRYCARVADVRPELAPLLTAIGSHYEQLRYAEDDTHRNGAELMRLLRECHAKV